MANYNIDVDLILLTLRPDIRELPEDPTLFLSLVIITRTGFASSR